MISFVYFDIGGVLVKDFSATNKWQEMEHDLGITQDKEAEFIKFWDKHVENIDTGQDVDNLVPLLRSEFNLKLPDDFSWLNDFIDRFEPNYTLWPIIQKIKKTTKVGLLTNLSLRMFDSIQASGLLPPVTWNAIVDSSIEQVRKPDPKIYEIARERSGVPTDKILFIDNMQKNLDTARSLGWQTFLYNPSKYDQSSQDLLAYLQDELFDSSDNNKSGQ